MTQHGGPLVMVVEEAEPPMRLLTWALRQEGLSVVSCSEEELVSLLLADPPALIVLNLWGATRPKRDVVRAARDRWESCPVVDLATDEDDTGADAVIEPPYMLSRIVALLHA